MTKDRITGEADVVTKVNRQSVPDTVATLTDMKVLIWADSGQTKVSYYAPEAQPPAITSAQTWPRTSRASTH